MYSDLEKYRELFLESSNNYLLSLKQSCKELSQDRQNSNAINNFFIAIHSLKGQSLAMGYMELGLFSAELEGKIRKIRGSRGLSEEELRTFINSIQRIGDSLASIKNSNEEIDLSEDRKKLGQII